jgi:hypothetical protein
LGFLLVQSNRNIQGKGSEGERGKREAESEIGEERLTVTSKLTAVKDIGLRILFSLLSSGVRLWVLDAAELAMLAREKGVEGVEENSRSSGKENVATVISEVS